MEFVYKYGIFQSLDFISIVLSYLHTHISLVSEKEKNIKNANSNCR